MNGRLMNVYMDGFVGKRTGRWMSCGLVNGWTVR